MLFPPFRYRREILRKRSIYTTKRVSTTHFYVTAPRVLVAYALVRSLRRTRCFLNCLYLRVLTVVVGSIYNASKYCVELRFV